MENPGSAMQLIQMTFPSSITEVKYSGQGVEVVFTLLYWDWLIKISK